MAKKRVNLTRRFHMNKRGGVPGTFSSIKFVTIALYATVLLGVFVGVVKGAMDWQKTGSPKVFIDATLGQVLYWDMQIYYGIDQLRDTQFVDNLPEGFQKDYKNFVIKQIILYVALFVIIGFLLFKAGNWLLGIHSMSWTSDVIVLAVIIFGVFPLMEMGYGWLAHDELVVPYRGVAQLVKPSTWDLLLGDFDATMDEKYYEYMNEGFNDTDAGFISTNNETAEIDLTT